jgi:hypothetical protein
VETRVQIPLGLRTRPQVRGYLLWECLPNLQRLGRIWAGCFQPVLARTMSSIAAATAFAVSSYTCTYVVSAMRVLV